MVRQVGQQILRHLFEVRKATVFARALDEPMPEYGPGVPLSVREMTSEDLDHFREPVSLLRERRIMRFARQLRAGRVGVIALDDHQVVGFGWLSLENEIDRLLNVEISLQQGEGYIYDGFVFPGFRGRNIYPALLTWRLDYLMRHGCRTAYSIVAVGNMPAETWHRRMGFRPQREIGYVKILGLKWHRSRPLSTAGAEGQ